MSTSGKYALEAAVAEQLLNRLLLLLISSGKYPTSFLSTGGMTDETIEFTERHRIALDIRKIEVFTETGGSRKLGLHVEFTAEVATEVEFKEWRDAASGALIDAALSDRFTIPIAGSFDAIGELSIQSSGGRQHVVLGFASLKELKIIHLGDLIPGPDFTELMRVLLERIAVTELRLEYTLPSLPGLPVSLPFPEGSLLDLPCAELGLLDFKSCDAPGDSKDDFHVLMQTSLNQGDERFSAVSNRSSASVDVALAISAKFIGQVKQELWQYKLIPRLFNDSGLPDSKGVNEITYLSLTPRASGVIGFRVDMRRPFLGGHINAKVMVEARPYIKDGIFRLDVLNEDVSLGWAALPGRATIFMLIYQVLLSSLFRGVDLLIDKWTDELIREFLEDLSIDVKQRFAWAEPGMYVMILPNAFHVSDLELSCSAAIKFN